MAARRDGRAELAADSVRVYTSDASDRIAAASRQVVAALMAQGVGGDLAPAIARLTQHDHVDTIAARRRIAAAVLAAGKHPF
jgi:hypothetical protein